MSGKITYRLYYYFCYLPLQSLFRLLSFNRGYIRKCYLLAKRYLVLRMETVISNVIREHKRTYIKHAIILNIKLSFRRVKHVYNFSQWLSVTGYCDMY